MARPPPLPTATKNAALARWLNLAVPGAGLYYLGHRRLGAALALPFLACFLAAFALFLGGYAHYLSVATSDNLLGSNQLERFGDIFPTASACRAGLRRRTFTSLLDGPAAARQENCRHPHSPAAAGSEDLNSLSLQTESVREPLCRSTHPTSHER